MEEGAQCNRCPPGTVRQITFSHLYMQQYNRIQGNVTKSLAYKAYRIKISNIKRGIRKRFFKMIWKQLHPCIIPHHHNSLSIFSQLQVGPHFKFMTIRSYITWKKGNTTHDMMQAKGWGQGQREIEQPDVSSYLQLLLEHQSCSRHQ